MTEDNREKRLYYLRKYNRYYKYQIDLLTDQSISLERQLNDLNDVNDELRHENERLKKHILKNETYSEKKPSQTLLSELMYIRQLIEQICATQHIPFQSNDFEQDRQEDHLIGAIHRQKRESTYANELRKEFVIQMNEETNDDRFNEEQGPSDTKDDVEQLYSEGDSLQDEVQTNDTNEEVRGEDQTNDERAEQPVHVQQQVDKSESTLTRQVKQYGKIEETSPQKGIAEQDEKQSLPSDERANTITFRDLQQATDIYAKPTTQMNHSKSTGNKKPQFDTPLTHVEQEEYFLPKLSKNHKRPEIVQKPIPERVEQPTQPIKNDQPKEELDEEKPMPNTDRAKEKIEQPQDEKKVTEKNDNQLGKQTEVAEKQVEDTRNVSIYTEVAEKQVKDTRNVPKQTEIAEKQVDDTSNFPKQTDRNEGVDHKEVSSLHPPVDSVPPKKEIEIKSLPIQEEIKSVEADSDDSWQPKEQAKQMDEKSIENTNQPTFLKTLWNKIKGI